MAKHPRTILLPQFRDNIKEWIENLTKSLVREFILLWQDSGAPRFVDRGNDTGSADFTQTSFTTDATWRDLDLSAIVPAGAVAVVLRVSVYDDLAGSYLCFRKNGSTNNAAVAMLRTQESNIYNDGVMIVPCDEARVVEYKGSDLTFTFIDVSIIGWFI